MSAGNEQKISNHQRNEGLEQPHHRSSGANNPTSFRTELTKSSKGIYDGAACDSRELNSMDQEIPRTPMPL